MGHKGEETDFTKGLRGLFKPVFTCVSLLDVNRGDVLWLRRPYAHVQFKSSGHTVFFFAVMITDFSMLKDFTKKRGLKYGTMFLVAIKPTQRTLHLEGKEDIHTLERYSTAAEWTFFGAASIVTAKAAATAP